MPLNDYSAIDPRELASAKERRPGYGWVDGCFGPPPGIPQKEKDELGECPVSVFGFFVFALPFFCNSFSHRRLGGWDTGVILLYVFFCLADRMTDREYLYAFLKMDQSKKDSLMVSEEERRRTFAAHWPIESIVSSHACAKEGFYFTGRSDRVQCTFCGGLVHNWERGDAPKNLHKQYFGFCKMVLGRPCRNVPADSLVLGPGVSSCKKNKDSTVLEDLNVRTTRPKNVAMAVGSARLKSYKRYPSSNPLAAEKLSQAGFVYSGTGDLVKCFWCDGGLEKWGAADDPWTEHAK